MGFICRGLIRVTSISCSLANEKYIFIKKSNIYQMARLFLFPTTLLRDTSLIKLFLNYICVACVQKFVHVRC